jgi:outer membrane protein assembly factor BamB
MIRLNTFLKSLISISIAATLLTSCDAFFDKDNMPAPAPLQTFESSLNVHHLWTRSIGKGVGKENLKLSPAIQGLNIFIANANGQVTAITKDTGKIIWQTNTTETINSGVCANSNTLFVGTNKGKVIALNQTNGKILWQKELTSEILAAPVATDTIVYIKTIDGYISALNTVTGQLVWHYQQTEPNLILRTSSSPLVTNTGVVVGFENGVLTKLGRDTGRVLWQQTIAMPEGSFAIDRMIDIDSDPVALNNRLYAAAYQGNIAALNLDNGNIIWQHQLSSYANLAVTDNAIFVTAANGHVLAFTTQSGTPIWDQAALLNRNLTGAVIFKNYVVVGDAQGYLHFMNAQDGHFVARVLVNKSGISATPRNVNNILYVLTKDGNLATYTAG